MPPLAHAQAQARPLLLAALAQSKITPPPLARPAPRTRTRAPSFLRAARAMDTPGQPFPLTKQIKFVLRSCLHPRKMRAWLARLSRPDLAPAFEARPRLALKPQLVLINYKWTPAERRALLDAHYEIIPRLLAPEILARACRAHHDLLHIDNPATGRRLAIRLLCRSQYEREGDLTLNLTDTATGLPLANISFSIGAAPDGGRILHIGGLQAGPDPRVRDLIHDIAKEMHGLRAKAFLLWVLQQLAQRWGVTSILAIDDANHATNLGDKHHKVLCSYDAFWRESGGAHNARGCWELPLQPHQRTRDETKPNKRRQYERRYALLAALLPRLQAGIDACAPGHPRLPENTQPRGFQD